MRVLTKQDLALIQGGSGSIGELEAELDVALSLWAEASSNMAYDAIQIAEGGPDQDYYVENFAENAEAAAYWSEVAAEIEAELS